MPAGDTDPLSEALSLRDERDSGFNSGMDWLHKSSGLSASPCCKGPGTITKDQIDPCHEVQHGFRGSRGSLTIAYAKRLMASKQSLERQPISKHRLVYSSLIVNTTTPAEQLNISTATALLVDVLVLPAMTLH